MQAFVKLKLIMIHDTVYRTQKPIKGYVFVASFFLPVNGDDGDEVAYFVQS